LGVRDWGFWVIIIAKFQDYTIARFTGKDEG
jgi:hypothetical protein